MARKPVRGHLWVRRLAWLFVIWLASITVLAIVAFLLRLVMNAAGLTT